MSMQVQGTCGVFSFWYATVLLRKLDATKPVTYPKESIGRKALGLPAKDPSLPRTRVVDSIRWYTKTTLKSGQGELYNAHEIEAMVTKFGYSCVVCIDMSANNRRKFIADSIAHNRPVLFSYTKSVVTTPPAPVDARSAAGTAGTSFGAHWSLIIDDKAGVYSYIDPHCPTKLQTFFSSIVLGSNGTVDSTQFKRFYGKPAPGGLAVIGDKPPDKGESGKYQRVYDLEQVGLDGKKRAQELNNLLVAVF